MGSGHARTIVPEVRAPAVPVFLSFDATSPPSKAISHVAPSRITFTSRRLERAFVTETPTPCNPPANAYAPPPFFSNLPPAWRRVKTTSTVGAFSTGCGPTGMPRPSSSTDTEPSLCITTDTRLANPASASSAALSIISWTMCNGLSVRVYMPGRARTGSRPLRTLIDCSSYLS